MRPIRSDRYRSPPYNLHRLMTSITLLHGRSDRSRPPRLFPPRPAYTRRDFAPDPSLAPPPPFEFSQSSPALPVTNICARASPRHEFSSGLEEGFARVSRERERGSKNCGGRGKAGAAFGVLQAGCRAPRPFPPSPLDSHNSVGSLGRRKEGGRERENLCVWPREGMYKYARRGAYNKLWQINL